MSLMATYATKAALMKLANEVEFTEAAKETGAGWPEVDAFRAILRRIAREMEVAK